MSSRTRQVIASLAIVLLLLSFTTLNVRSAGLGSLEVSFINVGQGDAELLHDANNFDVLIDGGTASAGPTVVAYLRKEGIDSIDVLVASHSDADHIGGLIDVLEATDIPIHAVVLNGYTATSATWNNFINAIAARGLTPTVVSFPADFQWGEMSVHVLNPAPGLVNPEPNDASIVLRVDHGDVNFLFTGDISTEIESQIINRLTPVAAEILKVAHHGSAYGSSSEFLSAVGADEAIIEVGTDNRYGHPDPTTLDRLNQAGVRTWYTNQNGDVMVVSDGSSYTISAEPPGYAVFMPVLFKGISAPTSQPTPDPVIPPPPPPSGENVQCRTSGSAEICAWVSDGTPAQYGNVTVYGRLVINNAGQAGQAMNTVWHYKTTSPSCSGTTGADGVASCSRNISRATLGYRVNIDVNIAGHSVQTWFTPQ